MRLWKSSSPERRRNDSFVLKLRVEGFSVRGVARSRRSGSVGRCRSVGRVCRVCAVSGVRACWAGWGHGMIHEWQFDVTHTTGAGSTVRRREGGLARLIAPVSQFYNTVCTYKKRPCRFLRLRSSISTQ